MGKKRWFSLIKRFFISETCENRSKDTQKKRWVFARRNKLKRLTPPPPLPPPPTELVKPVGQQVEPKQEFEKENAAAVTIQTAFRGFLARKALRALKALVRLQAIIRGRLVRRQAVTTLKRLQSLVNIHSQVCANRIHVADYDSHNNNNADNNQENKGKDIKSHTRWDDSILTKEEENALMCSKREAAMKRERIKEYAFNHRMSAESEQSKVNGKWRYWLEHWVDTQLAKQEDLENLGKKQELESQKVKLRNFKSTHLPRTIHHRKQRSIGEEHSISMAGSPVFPTYMAATESAKAKTRSLSSPRLRPISIDTCSVTNSPYKHKLLSPISSINSDAGTSRIWNVNGARSPSLQGRTSKQRSFSSDCSLPKWDQLGHFR